MRAPFVVLAAAASHLFATVAAVADLSFSWPKYPEENVQFSLQWSGGTAPVRTQS